MNDINFERKKVLKRISLLEGMEIFPDGEFTIDDLITKVRSFDTRPDIKMKLKPFGFEGAFDIDIMAYEIESDDEYHSRLIEEIEERRENSWTQVYQPTKYGKSFRRTVEKVTQDEETERLIYEMLKSKYEKNQ